MNARSSRSTIGLVMSAALAVGILAALPAYAGGALIKNTHSDTPYRPPAQPASSTVAKVQPAGSQAQPSEVQVAVMAKSPAQPATIRGVLIHR